MISSWGVNHGLQPPGKAIEVLRTLLTDRPDPARRLDTKQVSAFAGSIRDATLPHKRVEVSFLDLDFRTHV